MEQKTVEQIASEKYPFLEYGSNKDHWIAHVDSHNRNATLQRLGFIDGYTTAQQSQPMWREIEAFGEYDCCIVTSEEKRIKMVDWCAEGSYLLSQGYTHYLSSDDLLKLPTEKK